jgi:peptidoglycan/LPS O-acetylase OafA/YrhL
MVAYVVFAVIAWTGLMNRRQSVYFTTVLAAGFYTIVLYYKGSLFTLLDFGLLRCLAGFCVGVAVSTIPETPLAKIPTAIYNTAIGILTTIAIAVLSLLNGVFDIVIVPIFGLLVLLLQTDSGLPARILKTTPIAFLGQISYSIYMVHWLLLLLATTGLKYVTKTPLYDGMYKANLLLGDLGVILMLMLIVLVASITYRNIEAPWRSFGRRSLTLYTEAGVADRQISPA